MSELITTRIHAILDSRKAQLTHNLLALYGGQAEQYIETAVTFEDGRSGSVSATLKIADAKTFAATRKAA